jgi:hypothetical protein
MPNRGAGVSARTFGDVKRRAIRKTASLNRESDAANSSTCENSMDEITSDFVGPGMLARAGRLRWQR